jgi:hypothetical protein
VFADELMLECFHYADALTGVDVQGLCDEVPCFGGEIGLVGELELRQLRGHFLSSYLDDVVLVGRLPKEHFVGHDAETPNVDLLVVEALLELFGTDVGETADDGVPETVGEDRAAEVSDFGVALRGMGVTSLRKMFSGLMSRWMISSVCMYLSPSQICRT